jgi:hypothetical protein
MRPSLFTGPGYCSNLSPVSWHRDRPLQHCLHVPHVFAVVIEGDQPVFANLERAAEP